MKRILLLQHADLPHPETLDFACYMAKLLNSPVTGVFLEDDKRETLKRVAPEDIGGVVAFLCTDDARWINAQRIEVSGGQSL